VVAQVQLVGVQRLCALPRVAATRTGVSSAAVSRRRFVHEHVPLRQ